MLVRELQRAQRPRERFLTYGRQAVSTEELLAILLRTGRKGVSVIEVAGEVLEVLEEGAYSLNTTTVDKLCAIKGIGKDKAVTVCAAIELGKRLSELRIKESYEDFCNPKAVAAYAMERLRYEKEEHFCVALLNSKNRLIRMATISIGGLTASLAEQRVVFRKAVEANAASIILLHNHPSGDAKCSADDIRVTRLFKKAGEVMGIPILDHVIIGDGHYTSLCEEHLL